MTAGSGVNKLMSFTVATHIKKALFLFFNFLIMEQILQITSTKANQGLVLGKKKKVVCVSMHPFCLKRNPKITKKIYTTSLKTGLQPQ